MIRIRVVSSILLAAGTFLGTAGAAEPPFNSPVVNAVDERYFQREAENYLKFEQQGETVYCTSPKTPSEALVPHIGYARCITEANLRRAVRDWRRDRVSTAG